MAEYWPLLDYLLPWLPLLVAYPAYVLLMAGVLLLLGVGKEEVRKWALRQADRRRLIDLIRAARGLPEPPSNEDTPGR